MRLTRSGLSGETGEVAQALLRVGFAVGAACLLAAATQASARAQTPAPSLSAAPENQTVEARVTGILEEQPRPDGTLYQRLQMQTTSGAGAGETIVVENGALSVVNALRFRVGDELVLTRSIDPSGSPGYFITDYVRRDALGVLFAIFVIVTILVGGLFGATSLIGMAITFIIVFRFILPQILDGRQPIVVSILGALVIVPVTFYLSHGRGRKTNVAIVGTLLALIITGVLAGIFVEYARLSGFATEEASFLQVAGAGEIDMKGLLLAGIIIASLGVLDDITVSQASIVSELRAANPGQSRGEVFRRAMRVGRDHIASAVNTLVLVYAGASLPLLLLFVVGGGAFNEIVNYEFIAEEIVRTLVGCIGLVAAVPITTFIAAGQRGGGATSAVQDDDPLAVDFEPWGAGPD